MAFPRTPLKYVTTYNDEVLPESSDPDGLINYIEISDVDASVGITGSTKVKFSEAPSRARRVVRRDDVLISTVRTYLRAIASADGDHDGFIASTGFCILRPYKVHPGFLKFAASNPEFVEEVIARSTGISYPAINASDLVRLSIPAPSWTKQESIAKFLDRETAQIDGLIGKQEGLIELLAEKRQALITQAVTKGLDSTAPTKPAGIPWLGQIPAHWQVSPVGSSAVLIQTGPFGSQIHAEDYVAGGTPLINPSHLVEGRIAPNIEVAVSDDKAQELRRHALRTGDIVIARRGELGRNAVSTEQDDGFLCGTGSLLVRLRANAYLPEYFSLVFGGQHTRDRLSLQSIGATMDNLNAGLIARLRLVRPPIAEQESILRWLGETTDVLDKTTRNAVRSIDLLRERRSALISAAVTGKIDVREGAA